MTPARRALVSGAGVAGLSAALRLEHTGWDVVVIEQASSRRRGGAGVTVQDAAFDAVERLGLAAELREHHFLPTEVAYLRTDGEERLVVPRSALARLVGTHTVHVKRDDLIDVLDSAVTGDLRFATTIVDVEQRPDRVLVTFSDGRTEAFDVVIQATGAPMCSLRDPAGESHLAVLALPRQPAGIRENAVTVTKVPGGELWLLGLGERGAVAQLRHRREAEPSAARTMPALWHRLFGTLGGSAPDILAALELTAPVYQCVTNARPTGRWSHGRIVILGDAAWGVPSAATTAAITGAYSLGTVLQDRLGHLPALLRMWETRVRPSIERTHMRRAARRLGPGVAARLWRHGLALPI